MDEREYTAQEPQQEPTPAPVDAAPEGAAVPPVPPVEPVPPAGPAAPAQPAPPAPTQGAYNGQPVPPQTPYYGQPMPPVPPQAPAPQSNSMSIAALICGIVGLVGGWIPYVSYFTLIGSILGIVFGVKGRKENAAAGLPTGMATAGMVLGIVGVALTVLGIICLCAGLGMLGMAVDSLY